MRPTTGADASTAGLLLPLRRFAPNVIIGSCCAGESLAPGSLLRPTRLVDRPLAGTVRAPAAPTPCWRSAIALPQPAPYGLGLLFQLRVVAAGVARIVRRPSGADHARGQVVFVLVP